MPQAVTYDDIRDPAIRRRGMGKRRVSIDQRMTRLERNTEDFDREIVGAKAKCRAGNFEEASPRILRAELLLAAMTEEVEALRRQVREAGVAAALL